MGAMKQIDINIHIGDRCVHCYKKITEKELNRRVFGVPIKKFEDGTVGCADCMANIASGN